jgi:lipopolysaccharide exporter
VSLPEQAVRGVPWTVLSYAANKLLTVGTTVVLARLLDPDDFGLWTLAFFTLMLMSPLRDLGVGAVLVIRPLLDRRTEATALSLMLAVSALAGVLVAALSPVAARLFHEPRLAGVLRAITVTLFLVTLAWFYESLMQRQLEFRKRFWAQTAQNAGYVPTALALAVLGAGVWSLAIGYIVGTAMTAVAFVALAPHRVRPAFDRGVARSLLSEGWGFVAQASFAFLRQNADYLAVGRVLGTQPLGVYSMGYRISELPYLALADPVSRVTMPAFAQMRARAEEIGPVFLRTVRAVAAVACLVGALLSATAYTFTPVVLGPKWLPMAGVLAVLGVWSALRAVEWTVASTLNATGGARPVAITSGLVLVALVPAAFVAARLGGIEAVAFVTLADMLLTLPVLAVIASRRLGLSVSALWGGLRSVALASAAAWVAAPATAVLSDEWSGAVGLSVSIASGLAVYGATLLLVDRPLLSDAWRQLGSMVERAARAESRRTGGA